MNSNESDNEFDNESDNEFVSGSKKQKYKNIEGVKRLREDDDLDGHRFDLSDYVCEHCNRENIKLWRDAHSFRVNLTCYNCSGETREIDDKGKVECSFIEGRRTDQIHGSRVPAVPRLNHPNAYWGYSSVPPDRVKWWIELKSK